MGGADVIAGSSPSAVSRSELCSSVSQSSLSSAQLSDSSIASDRESALFNPQDYLKFHKEALLDREQVGSTCTRMRVLYRSVSRPMRRQQPLSDTACRHAPRYWTNFLVNNFNEAMYKSFVVLAQEDAAGAGDLFGLRQLFKFYSRTLSESFDEGRRRIGILLVVLVFSSLIHSPQNSLKNSRIWRTVTTTIWGTTKACAASSLCSRWAERRPRLRPATR